MKKWILVYDGGEVVCSVQVEVDDSKLNMPEKVKISYNDVEYTIMYVMGMDYAIIIPEKKVGIEFSDNTYVH